MDVAFVNPYIKCRKRHQCGYEIGQFRAEFPKYFSDYPRWAWLRLGEWNGVEQQTIRRLVSACICKIRCTITPPLHLPAVLRNSNTKQLSRVVPAGDYVVEGICLAVVNLVQRRTLVIDRLRTTWCWLWNKVARCKIAKDWGKRPNAILSTFHGEVQLRVAKLGSSHCSSFLSVCILLIPILLSRSIRKNNMLSNQVCAKYALSIV